MNVKGSTVDGRVPVAVVHVNSDIDSSMAEAFETKMDELIKGGARYILLLSREARKVFELSGYDMYRYLWR